jgi:hypothetical protein
MATGLVSGGRARIESKNLRRDRWWLLPGITAVVLLAFVVYATWRAFVGEFYYSTPYLSPFYSPCLSTDCVEGSSDLGQPITFWPLSPALIILIIPLGFRLTCYYYRKAYYRSFWMSPPACAVPEPHRRYTGETRFPLILQNVHRWFFYLAMLFNLNLTFDAVLAFRDTDGNWGHMGLGTVVLVVNAALLWMYTLSCHSCRHVIGGKLRHFSRHPIRYRMWSWVSNQNGSHPTYAWLSLFSVALADLYVFLLANGTIEDLRFF